MVRRWFAWGALGIGAIAFFTGGCGKTPATSPAPVSTPIVQRPVPPPPPPVPKPEPPPLKISPQRLALAPGDDGAQVLAEIAGEHGGRRDVTRNVLWSIQPSEVAAIGGDGYVRRRRPGRATISGNFEGQVGTAQLTVEDEAEHPWSFAEDIVPILTRAGCNTGGCHGRADGQNGFHLSLFGYDPAGDWQAVARDAGQRRISRFDPGASLLLGKATGRVPHPGGQRVVPESPEYRTLLEWVKAGAPEARGKTHGPLTGLSVEPPDARLDEPGPLQLRVVAHYADGHVRDVTRLAIYRVNDDSAAKIDARGNVSLLRRAEADLVVRYQSQVVSTRLATIINPGLEFNYAKLTRRNFIDEELFKRLESLKVPPSPRSSDTAFLRRVSLDLTGEQPLPEQVREFLADEHADKRTRLVDSLLAKREFSLFWRIKFGDLLQITSNRFGNGAARYQAWIDEQLLKNAPWDQTVRTLLTALGKPEDAEGGPVNYALDGPDAKTQAEQTAQRFLGLRIRCAQCHDHPFDVWTQDDYFGLAACFAKVQRAGGGGMMGKPQVKLNPDGQVEHLRTKKPASPRLLDGTLVKVANEEDPRKPLADWITRPENPYFARATANFVWAQLFGKGIADPPDDLSRSNPPVHPELLDALGKHFVAHKYDLRDLIRTIVTSEAYGLSSSTVPGNEQDTRLFSHQVPRPLTAHQMADAIAQVTEVQNRFPGANHKRLAIEVPDPSTASQILDTFGRCLRTNGCASVPTPALSLGQSLLLIGGDVIESKIASPNGYVANLFTLDPPPGPEDIVENLYLRTLCRPALPEEISKWSAELKQAGSLREATEDLFWALLNSREFAFNH
ncbi:MAG: DUF1549 and DUF1553 domain-containing protein [Isosphaeraceae bacterium]|nr:DUF1549 and DUF1553 domain-containing protein [Isosphaeraceae bacterium]